METISEKVRKITEDQLDKFSKDSKYNELKDYYTEMKNKGLISPQTYNIPPLDTIGERLYNSKQFDETTEQCTQSKI
ncbi:MAG: hypothetical protein PHR19_05920 [Bacteroidales bacterium]|jgi:hypothetical protein|nr:hypothetical protein [Bacteroidales bacterium]HHT52267.1 hypothetical protein [Bacteroidales bacterium]